MTFKVVPLKQKNTQSRISLETVEQCSSNLALECTQKKENATRVAVAMTTVMPLVLF